MRHFNALFLTLLVVLMAATAQATHIYGADFFYEAISRTTYRITLVVYGDCSGAQFPSLQNASPQVQVKEGGFIMANLSLLRQGAGVEVTPVCPRMADSTRCRGLGGNLPGVTKYTYSATYTVAYPSASWAFYFTGAMGTGVTATQAGRSGSITNLTFAGGSIMVLEALLNNTKDSNSSPRFTTIPTPFYCVNVPQQYNQGAVDPQNDSLVYSLAPGLEATGPVSYLTTASPPYTYSATAPLHTATGSVSFNPATGQLSFTPDIAQQSLVVNKVSEYRNGVLVGTASREMTFVVLQNCNNAPSTGVIDTAAGSSSGGMAAGVTTFNVCHGTDSVQFRIVPLNPAQDTIDVEVNGLPAGATAVISQNHTPNPVVSFSWKPAALNPGTYNFFVAYKDKGCPLSSQQTLAYTIQVLRPNGMTAAVLTQTQCIRRALVQYNFSNGLLPRTVTISQGGTTVSTYTDHTGLLVDSLAAGNYTVTITSPNLPCASVFPLRVADSGLYPFMPKITTPVFYCKNDQPYRLQAVPDTGAVIRWYDGVGAPLLGTPLPRTDTTGIFTWYLRQRFKVCESLLDSITVYVTDRPIASIDAPPSICLDDTANILFNGRVGVGPILNYVWTWGQIGYVHGDGPGPYRAHWFSPGEKKIKLYVVENQCVSDEIEQTLVVKPMPYAGFDADAEVCQHDSLRVIYNSRPFEGQRYAWNFAGADTPLASGPGPYTIRWNATGIKQISLSLDLDGCTDTQRKQIIVRPAPLAQINNAPGPVCIGDKIFLTASGGSKYLWQPADSIQFSPDGRMFTQILKPTVYRVRVISDYGCVDSAAISYSRVDPCCNFAYPNAFTPNGDGRNDRFRIVTHGNHLEYELSIYNNWGQRVYYGLDAEQGWDGTFNGKPCDAGTYFYYLNAKCFTDHRESHKGSVMLIK